MRVALVHTPKIVRVAGQLDSLFATAMPMGMFSLADELERGRHEVEILHAGVELALDRSFDLASTLSEGLPRLVGFSLHWHHQLPEVLAQAEAVRRSLHQVTIVVGGLTATVFDREILERCRAIDAVVRGDAELPLKEYADCVEWDIEPEEVPNLTWRRGREIVRNELAWHADEQELSQFDFARLDLLRHAEHYGGDPWMPLYGASPSSPARRTYHLTIGRGCTWDCGFCAGCRKGHELFTGRKGPVFRRVESVLANITRVLNQGIDSLYVCYDPFVASRPAYFLELFGRIREAGLRPAIDFECFSAPDPDFVRAFARTVDRERSTLVLSPGTAVEAIRHQFHGPSCSNAEIEAALSMAQGCGVATHVCFSVYPPEGWPEARSLQRWQRSLAARFGCSRFVCPIEMEPWAPWQLEPERYGLEQVRSSFDDYLERHRRPGHQERAWEEEVGYATTELAPRTLLLRSETERPDASVWAALAGLWRREGARIVLGPADALDAMLEVVGRWQPGQIALVVGGDLDDDAKEAVARRVASTSPSVARLFFLCSNGAGPPGLWSTVPYRVEQFRAPLPERSDRLTAKSLVDRRDASVLARLVLDNPESLAEDLRERRCVLVDACRFGRTLCPALSGSRLVFGPDGEARGCGALALERRAGDGWEELVARLRDKQRKLEQQRGCQRCPAFQRCARCPAPEPLKVKEYCAFMREDDSFNRFADQMIDPPSRSA